MGKPLVDDSMHEFTYVKWLTGSLIRICGYVTKTHEYTKFIRALYALAMVIVPCHGVVACRYVCIRTYAFLRGYIYIYTYKSTSDYTCVYCMI